MNPNLSEAFALLSSHLLLQQETTSKVRAFLIISITFVFAVMGLFALRFLVQHIPFFYKLDSYFIGITTAYCFRLNSLLDLVD